MKKQMITFKERILAAVLAFIMIVTMLPAQSYAATEQYPNDVTVHVTDSQDAPVAEATVTYTLTKATTGEPGESQGETQGETAQEYTVTTDEDGVAVIPKEKDGASLFEVGDTISYTVGKEGFETSQEQQHVVKTLQDNIEVQLALKMHTVTVTAEGEGAIQYEGQPVEGSISVEHGAAPVILVTPKDGYYLKEVSVGGQSLEESALKETKNGVECTLPAVVNPSAVTVVFEQSNTGNSGDDVLNTDAYEFKFEHGEGTEVVNSLVRTYKDENRTIVILKKGGKATLMPKNGVKSLQINEDSAWKNSIVITETTDITKIITSHSDFGWMGNKTEYHNPIHIEVDNDMPTVTVAPKEQKAYYNADVPVAVSLGDQEGSEYDSSIEKVTYQVLCGGVETQNGTLYTAKDGEYDIAPKLLDITVEAAKNSGSNVEVVVTAVDRAGNEAKGSCTLDIDTKGPEVQVSYDNNTANKTVDGRGYFDKERTATVVVTERNFDSAAAVEGIDISAKNASGEEISEKTYTISDWKKVDGATPDETTYTATIHYQGDANYEFAIQFSDKAGNENEAVDYGTSVTPKEFTVDAQAPEEVKISLDAKHTWQELLRKLTFGVWKNYDVTVTASAKDQISPIDKIEYYKTDATAPLGEEELDALYAEDKFVSDEYTFTGDERVVVYARITDYAGNACYISTDGIVIDKTKSIITLTPQGENKNENGVYNGDVHVGVTLEDPGDGTYSGIKSVTYEVFCDGERTQEGTLYTFDKENPSYDELENKLELEDIVVDAEKNNSSNVEVKVTALDNAENETSASCRLDIDNSEPEISVSYDNNDVHKTVAEENAERGYFGAARTATVTIKERTQHFDGEKAKEGIVVTAKDAAGNDVADAYRIGEKWETTEGDTPDEATHTITVEYLEDANYTFSVSYVDQAGKPNKEVDYGESVTPEYFTVDTRTPLQESEDNVTIKASGTGWEKVWNTLLEILTFGIWKADKVSVEAEAKDFTSPLEAIAYYKTDETTALDADELAKYYEEGLFTEDVIEVGENERFVVYARVEDYAGNVCFVSTDGMVADATPAEITLTPSQPNDNQAYNEDVRVKVDVEDSAPYSGIQSVKYRILCDGEETETGTLFEYTKTEPTHEELVSKPKLEEIVVKAEDNNHSDVEVVVTVLDNAGNESEESCALDIDITEPEIQVSYDNNQANKVEGERGYFGETRTATVLITERTNHFDKAAAREGIQITAVDAKGNPVEKALYTIGDWTTKEGETPDEAVHTATISYPASANYTFDISYTDKAGNENEAVDYGTSVTPKEFTVDAQAPTGMLKASAKDWEEEMTWTELLKAEDFFFGLWSREGIQIQGSSEDAISPIDTIEYYKGDSENVKTEEELDKITDWKAFSAFTVMPNERVTVYLRMTDYAGNVSYISTNGMIADNITPKEETIAPKTTISPQQPVNGIYNNDVDVDIKAVDPVVEGIASGLDTVRYEVLNMGKVTQSGVLYDFVNERPGYNQLKVSWEGKITVDKQLNNSNDVVVKVYAEDNAGNQSMDKVAIKIDITAPQISVSYDNNSPDSEKYYRENRVATVVVTERNFRAEDVKITVESQQGNQPSISGWTRLEGTGNKDNTTYTATIAYTADDDYTFSIAYADLAGNRCQGESYAAGTQNPKEFTIDKTIPTMSVSYDNNSAQNGNYYQAERVATVSITEHNFDAGRVRVNINATDNGSAVSAPSVSGWSTNGDVHTATIRYGNDALYTFDLAYTDMAGNEAAPYTTETFYVDKTKPSVEISKIVDQSANADEGDIGFVVTAQDTNFDVFQPTLKAVVRDGNNFVTEEIVAGEVADTTNGKIFTVKNLEKDGMYYLTCDVVDKAGNAFEEIKLYDENGAAYVEKRAGEDTLVSFSVNRDGSVYDADGFTKGINNGYVQELYDDIILVETNTDTLVKKNVTVNGEQLKEGTDYTVRETAGEGRWNQYTYMLSPDYFEEEGEYNVVVSSEDKAGSKAFSDVKGISLKFTIDRTAPVVTVSGLNDNGRYQAQAQEVTVIPTDDGGKLKSVWCEVLDKDGNTIKEVINLSEESLDKELAEKNGKLSFTIDEGMYQQVRIICKDSAVNEKGDTNTYDYTYENVTVSSNVLKLFWANTMLRYAVFIIAAAIVGGLFVFFVWKRKKDDDSEKTAYTE